MNCGSQRQCPHCRVVLEIDSGFRFDEELNLICTNCDKIAGPVDFKSEPVFTTTYTGNPTGYKPGGVVSGTGSHKNTNTSGFGNGVGNTHQQRQHQAGNLNN